MLKPCSIGHSPSPGYQKMSNDSPLDVATAGNVTPPPTAADQLTPDQTVDILRRLRHVFALADDLISSDLRGRIWVVHGVVGGQAPVVESFESKADLCKLITEIRTRHNAEPENEYFLHMFYGQRWAVQKGRMWKLWDGRTLMPVEGGDVADFLDISGRMGERPDLDDVVSDPPDMPPADPPPAEGIQATPTAAAELRTAPPVVGEEAAPPGEDPHIEE